MCVLCTLYVYTGTVYMCDKCALYAHDDQQRSKVYSIQISLHRLPTILKVNLFVVFSFAAHFYFSFGLHFFVLGSRVSIYGMCIE